MGAASGHPDSEARRSGRAPRAARGAREGRRGGPDAAPARGLRAIALNDVAIDVLALQLDSNRNAIYKNLFDARRKLRASLAAVGHPLSDEEAHA
jgi:hypothetical protein